ncbi:MAG: GAF domain-containing protein, partial [Chloroflexota bacterium]
MDGVSLGLVLILAALALIALVGVFLRVPPRGRAAPGTDASPVLPFESKTSDAILIVQPGGRVDYMNAQAYERFGMPSGETPDLERLARRVRPSEDFLELCITESQKRFSVNGRLTDASSYRVPGYAALMLISFRSVDLGPALASGSASEGSGSVLKAVSEFGQAVSANLRMADVLPAVFQGVGRLVSADVIEAKTLDPASGARSVYRYEEIGGEAKVANVARSQFGWYTDVLFESRQPLFAPEGKEIPPPNSQSATRERSLVKSYIGIPFLVDGELIGSLEVGQNIAAGFNQQDFELLKLVAPQAGIAMRNARRYESQQAYVTELTGLTRLSQAAGSIQDSEELFARLVETVAPLFPAEILGFLLYNETDRLLEAKAPFQGLPVNVVNVYRSVIPPDSPGDQVIREQAALESMDAPRDAAIRALGLNEIAQLASLRETVMVPLLSGGRLIGYFQIANHRGGTAMFTTDELRLAKSIAGQASAIIDNAILVQQARQRALRSESLRRIANLVASSATLDEILQFSVQELAQLLKADSAAVFLLNQQTHEVLLHAESAWGVRPEMKRRAVRLEVNESQFRRATVSGTQRPFLSGRLSADERVSPAYREVLDAVLVESAIIVPLLARERSVGELMLGSRMADFFNSYDLQVLSTAAGLLAAAVEGASLMTQTDESLRRRVDELTAVTHVTREMNSARDVDQLLEVIHEQSLRVTRADCGTILLFDPESDPAEPRVTFSLGCTEEPLSSLARQALASGQPLLVSDFEKGLFTSPHSDVNSALVAPILHQGKTLGVIHLHAAQPGYFDQFSLEILQTLSMQAAIALGNAQRFHDQYVQAEQLRRRASTLAH